LRWYLKLQRDVTVQLEGFLQLEVTKDHANLDHEDGTVRFAALVQDAEIWDSCAVKHIGQGNLKKARQCKQQQIIVLRKAILEDRSKMNVVTRRALQHSLERAEHVAVQMQRDDQQEMILRCCVQELPLASWATSDSKCTSPRTPPLPRPLSSGHGDVPRIKKPFLERFCPCAFNAMPEDTDLQHPNSSMMQLQWALI